MKAAQINAYGGPEVLVTNPGASKPEITESQVLVEVYAAGVNPFDWKVREGYMQEMLPLKFPATLGGDVAGIVSVVGEGVTNLQVGDEVYGQTNAVSGVGSFAEFTPVSARQLSAKPKSCDFVMSAGLPLAGCSAHQALVDHINLQQGQKILIHGGAGGIGSLAIQLAKHLGAYVATTVAGKDTDFAKGLGADEVIDYKTQDFSDLISGYDAVFDTVGGETAKKSYSVLRPSGILVSMAEPADEALAKQHKVTSMTQGTKTTSERLAKLAELVDQGIMTVTLDKIFSLDEAGEALGYLQNSKHHGKVVVKVK